MLEGINVLCHSSIKIEKEKIIYIDPFNVKTNYNDADLIFITHSHYDHFSKEDINKVKKQDTMIICTEDCVNKAKDVGFDEVNIFKVIPNQKYEIDNIEFTTIPSYNINKNFHPIENNWVGYIIKMDNYNYYIAGDTDMTEENKNVKCDVAFIPVGGTYTMDFKEAAELTNIINPKIAIPIHYGEIVGTIQDAEKYENLLNKNIECKIFIK